MPRCRLRPIPPVGREAQGGKSQTVRESLDRAFERPCDALLPDGGTVAYV